MTTPIERGVVLTSDNVDAGGIKSSQAVGVDAVLPHVRIAK